MQSFLSLKIQSHKHFAGIKVEDLNFLFVNDRDARLFICAVAKVRRDGAGVQENSIAALFQNSRVNMSGNKNIRAELFSGFVLVVIGRQLVPVIDDNALAVGEDVRILGKNWHFQNKLINFRIAIAASYHERNFRAVNKVRQSLRIVMSPL